MKIYIDTYKLVLILFMGQLIASKYFQLGRYQNKIYDTTHRKHTKIFSSFLQIFDTSFPK